MVTRLLLISLPLMMMKTLFLRLQISIWTLLFMLFVPYVSFAQDACLTSQADITEQFLWSLLHEDQENTIVWILVGNKDTSILKNRLVEYYCDTWLQSHGTAKDWIKDMVNWCVDTNNMRFDPRQSLFMYGLCVWYDEAHKWKPTLVSQKQENYIHRDWKNEAFAKIQYTYKTTSKGEKWKTIKWDITDFIPDDSQDAKLLQKWRKLDKENDPCQPESGMSECLMWYPTSNILKTVFSGLFDLKKAAIDWFNHWTDEESIVLSIKDLSISLYDQLWPENSVCNNPDKQYLMNQDFWSTDKQSHCGHLKTRGEVKWIIKAAIKDVEWIKELNGVKIAEAECTWIRDSLIPCAMSNMEEGTEGKEDIIFASEEWSWRNLILNELFFADMRIEFYTMIIQSEPTRQSQQAWSVLDKNVRIDFEIQSMKKDFELIEKSADRLLNMLWQYRTMYHQCITLKAYQEDLHYYWSRINKTYTPLHQLQYTTEDAQEQGG